MKDKVFKYLRYARAFLRGSAYYVYDLCRFIKYSRLYTDSQKNETENRMFYSLMAKSHVIEKGLSMPERRLGFGHEALLLLIDELEKYERKYAEKNAQIEHIIGIILEYNELHEKNNYKLDENLQKRIDEIATKFQYIIPSQQVRLSKELLFRDVDKSFDRFSNSRRSCRHISGPADIATIREAIKLSLNAPSACNKQPVKVHLITDLEKVKELLELQQGNRGFGHLLQQLLLITVDIRSYGRFEDRYNPYLDAGLFSMNLLYSLHFYKIASIPLVWIDSKNRNAKLHKLVDFHLEEYPCLMIGIGMPAQEFITTASQRNKIEDVLTEH